VSILESSAGASSNVIASTLSTERHQVLRESLQLNVESELKRIAYRGEEFTSLIRELYLDPSADQRILAVIHNVFAFQNLLIQFCSIALVLSVLAVINLSRSMTNPISSLAEAVKRIGEGNYDESVRIKPCDELG